MTNTSILIPRPGRHSSLAKKLGTGAFLFFLIKGLAWLVLPLLATWLW